jgi:hypothetical protein
MASRCVAKQVSSDSVHEFLTELVEENLHAKRVMSLGNAVVGAIHTAALGVSAIGRGLATVAHLEPKHAIKQVDRPLSNMKLDTWTLFPGGWLSC